MQGAPAQQQPAAGAAAAGGTQQQSGAPNGAPAAVVVAPVFLSGSHFRELVFGQDIPPANLVTTDRQKRLAARKARGQDKGGRDARIKRALNAKPVTMRELMDAGFMKSGEGTVTVTYKGTMYRANMLPTAQIEYNGQVFDAPSAFSVHVKRLQTPSKQGDDGWRSVHVDGVALEEHRQKMLAQRSAGGHNHAAAPAIIKKPSYTLDPPAPSPFMQQLPEGMLPMLPSALDFEIPKDPEPEPAQEAGGEGGEEGEEEPDTNNWVQCSRCQVWRVVPDEFWPDIDAAGEEDWFCEEAVWDLTAFDPHTPGCKKYPVS